MSVPRNPLTPVELVSADIIDMDKGTFMWVQLTHFTFDAAQSDASVLTALIASDGYAHDYASPFPSHPQPFDDRIHGRWRLSAIGVERFLPFTAAEAVSQLQRWANDQEWTEPGYRQPAEVMERLEHVFELLPTGTVYRLDNPSPADEHEYGFVTGGMGFHEFVVIDHSNARLHVIVASDD